MRLTKDLSLTNGAVPTILTAVVRADIRFLDPSYLGSGCKRMHPKPTRTRPAFADDGRTRPMERGFAHILLLAGVDLPNMIRTSVQHTASAQNVINQHPAKPAPLSATSWPDVCERRGDLPLRAYVVLNDRSPPPALPHHG